HRKVFVLGVYPSAVHARWHDPDGNMWPALAIDNEPEPFWTGEGAESKLARLARSIPPEAGRLEPADRQHNGGSGRVLDASYLQRLGRDGVPRDDCWVTDVVQTYLANPGQLRRIRVSYEPLVERGIVRAASL